MSNFSPPPSPLLLLVDAGVDIAGVVDVVDEDDALLAAAAARALDLVLLPVVAVAVRLLLPGKGVSSSIKSDADSSNESMESLLPGVRYDIMFVSGSRWNGIVNLSNEILILNFFKDRNLKLETLMKESDHKSPCKSSQKLIISIIIIIIYNTTIQYNAVYFPFFGTRTFT